LAVVISVTVSHFVNFKNTQIEYTRRLNH